MTDQTNASVELAIKEEIAQIAGWTPETNLEDIGNQLGQLYNVAAAAGDENSMAIIDDTFDKIETMIQQGAAVMEIAIAAKASLQEAIEQRDGALTELNELAEAMDNPFYTDNERVKDMVEFVEEYASENMEEYMSDVVYDELYYSTVERLTGIGVNRKKAESFADLTCNDYYMDLLAAERKAELRDFIERFIVIEEANS